MPHYCRYLISVSKASHSPIRFFDKIIAVREKENENVAVTNSFVPPPIDISGRVADVDGNPLQGANVRVKGTTQGTTTDANGVFVLKGVDENGTLEISYTGYQSLSIFNKK
jgi:hypothetical protein